MANESVMAAWDARRPVVVSEEETLALIEEAVAPRFVQLTWGARPVRMLPHEQSEWAFRAVAEMRGELEPVQVLHAPHHDGLQDNDYGDPGDVDRSF